MARWGTHHSPNPHPSNRAASSGCPQPAPPCPSQLTLHPRPVAFIPSGPARSAPPPHTAPRSGAEPPALQPGPGPRTPSATPAPSRPDPTAAPTRASGRGSLFYFLFFFLFFFPPPVGNIAFNYDNKSKETSGARIITSEEARCNRRCRYPARGGRDAATPPPDATRSAPGRATCAPPLSDWPRPRAHRESCHAAGSPLPSPQPSPVARSGGGSRCGDSRAYLRSAAVTAGLPPRGVPALHGTADSRPRAVPLSLPPLSRTNRRRACRAGGPERGAAAADWTRVMSLCARASGTAAVGRWGGETE